MVLYFGGGGCCDDNLSWNEVSKEFGCSQVLIYYLLYNEENIRKG